MSARISLTDDELRAVEIALEEGIAEREDEGPDGFGGAILPDLRAVQAKVILARAS